MDRARTSDLAAAPGRRTLGWADGWILVGLIGLAVVLPAVIGAASGSLDIPRNDDWTFRRIALGLYETGRLQLNGFEAMVLIGQILIAQPFLWLSRGETWGLSVAGIAFATIAVAAGYLLVRRVLPRGRATLAILLLAFFPGYLPYATSFMTDVPAIAASFACLWLGAVALEERPMRLGWLAGSLAVGIVGFSIREFALAAPASVLLLAILAEPRRIWPWLGTAIFLGACIGLYIARSTLPGEIGTIPHPQIDRAVDRLLLLVSTISLVVLPAVLVGLATWWRSFRIPDVGIGVVVALVLLSGRIAELTGTRTVPRIVLDNLMGPWGVPGPDIVIGNRPILIPALPWSALNGLALVSTILFLAVGAGMLGGLLRGGRIRRALPLARSGSPWILLALFVGSTVLGVVVFGLFASVYDRYAWPIVPPLAALFLVPRPSSPPESDIAVATPRHGSESLPAAIGSLAVMLVLAVVSLSYLLNSAAFDSARWRAGESLVHAGIPAETVDAGFEWVGYHAPGRASTDNDARARNWWEQLYPRFHLCGLVATRPQRIAGATLVDVDTSAYRLLWLGGAQEPLYTYRIVGPGCP